MSRFRDLKGSTPLFLWPRTQEPTIQKQRIQWQYLGTVYKMAFINLSSDLLLLISDHFDRQYDLYALSLVCQSFHDLFINQLYLFNIRYRRSTALFWAAEDGRTLSLRRILTLRRDNSRIDDEFPVDFFYSKTYRGKTPLYLALSRGHHDAVKLLLEYGADPLLRCPLGLTPLYAACLSGKDEVVEIISKHIQDLPNYLVDLKKGFSPLHMACRYGISKSARQFLLHGVDVNAKDKRGRTALRIALTTIFRGFSEATQRKMKPSHTAIFESVRVLIEYGAHPYLSTESLVFLGKSRVIPTAANIGALNMDRDVRALFKPALVSKKHSLLVIENLNKPSLMNSGNDRCKCLKFSPYEIEYVYIIPFFLYKKIY